jgi:hypothetical protein
MNAESQDSKGQQPAMLAALEAVANWQREVEEDAARRQRDVDSEEERLQSDIAELQRQLKNISSLRVEANKQLEDLPAQVEQRTHEAILGALQADGELLAERAAQYTAAAKARDEKVSTLASEPGMAQKLEAFEQLELNRESTLGAVPAFYRNLLLQQHEENRRQLAPLFEALSAEVPTLEVDHRSVTIVASVDPVSGPPEALAVILPIAFDAYQRWADRDEDMQTWIGYRVVSAVSAALNRIGASDARLQFVPYKNEQLAIQVWLADSEADGDLVARLNEEIERLKAGAAELRTAGLDIGVTWQRPEVIAPASDEQED